MAAFFADPLSGRDTSQEADAIFETTFEKAGVGLAHVSPDGSWLRVNQHLCDVLGYEREELLATNFQALTHPDDLATDLDSMEEVLKGTSDKYAMEKRYIRKDGAIIWARLTVAPKRDEEGRVEFMISCVEDITRKRLTLAALSKSEQLFRAVQQTSPDGFMTFRTVRNERNEIVDFFCTFMNPAAETIVGRTTDQMVGKRLLEELPGNRTEGLYDAYVRVVTTGETWQREFKYEHEGMNAWFRATAAKADDGFAVSFADISENKENELRLQRILGSIVTFVGVLDRHGTLLEANHPALAAASLQREDVVGKKFWDCYWWSHDPVEQERLKDSVARACAGETVRYDAEVRTGETSRMMIDFQLAPSRNAAGQIIELIPSGVDITDRKRAEAHRELLLKELSHRVKNSLATVQAMASHTLRDNNDMESFRSAFLGRLRAISACHELLVNAELVDADLRALVESQVSPYAGDTSSSLSLDGPRITISGEQAHAFGLILHELATNAAKYGGLSVPEGRVEISWRAICEEGRNWLELDWREAGGPGVTPPTRRGFGSVLIERSLGHSVGGESDIDYEPDGLKARFRLPRDDE